MKFLSFGILFFAMTFCGISDRLKSMSGGSNSSSPSNTSRSSDDTGGDVETATLTPEQQAIMDANKEMTWDDQGISWKIPESWKKMELRKESLNYGSPDLAFLIGTISVM